MFDYKNVVFLDELLCRYLVVYRSKDVGMKGQKIGSAGAPLIIRAEACRLTL